MSSDYYLRIGNDESFGMSGAPTLAAFFLVLFVVVHTGLKMVTQKQSKSPQPPFCPAGFLDVVIAIVGGRLPKFLIENFKKCGPIFRLRLPIPGAASVIVVASPDDARQIYHDLHTTKPRQLYEKVRAFAGDDTLLGLPGKKGDSWAHRRRAINPAFASQHIRRMGHFAEHIVDEWIVEKQSSAITQVNEEIPSISFDAGSEMVKVTISVICQAAFGYPISAEERDTLLEDFKLAWDEFSFKSVFNPLRQFATWFLPERQRAFQAVERIQGFAEKVVAHYKAGSKDSNTVIDLIMNNANYKNEKEIYGDIIVMLFAGHDTTGYTLAFALLELAKNPIEQQALREELLQEDLQKDETNQSESMLKRVIKETMRMHLVTPVTGFKTLGRDFVTESGGFLLPKSSIIFMATCAIFQDPSLFENPEKFQPSRWINPSEQAKRAFFPFSLGRRSCVGQPLAIAELEVFLSRLIKQFQFSVEEEGEIRNPSTLRLDGCILKMTKL